MVMIDALTFGNFVSFYKRPSKCHFNHNLRQEKNIQKFIVFLVYLGRSRHVGPLALVVERTLDKLNEIHINFDKC